MPSPYKKSFAAEQRKLRPKKKTGLWIILGVLGVVVVVGGYTLYSRFWAKEEPTPEKEQIKSIAVLPFRDLSPNKDQDYFCEGIADEIINTLTPIEGLRVIASTSSFSYQGKDVHINDIGKELNVETVLEGSVRKEGNNLRITAQLIKVDDESHLWSDQYDRKLESIFAIQSEIALAIVKELKGELLSEEKAAIEKRYTNNPEAYELYLLGRNSKGINREKRLEYYQKAIELDPDFALAYVRIAWTYYMMGLGELPIEEAIKKGNEALEKALEIDDELAEVHILLAVVKSSIDWDWPAAEREYKRAIELNPGNEEAHFRYAKFLRYMKRCDEALVENKRARELNPLYMGTYHEAIAINIILGRYDDALKEFEKGKMIDPDDSSIYQHLGRLYRKQCKYKEAIDAFKKQFEISGSTLPHLNLGITYALSDEREKAEEILHALIERKKEGYGSSQNIALIYTALGEKNKAFEWLDRAYEERDAMLVLIKSDYEWDPIRSDPRFKALLKKMGFPE